MFDPQNIALRQYVGYSKGLASTQPIDVVIAQTQAGDRRIGFVDQKPGAMLRFIHYFPDADFCQAIRRRVAELRSEAGGFEISDLTVGPPNPRMIKGYLKGEKYRERPTTIVMPDGEPAGTVTEMVSESEWSEDDE